MRQLNRRAVAPKRQWNFRAGEANLRVKVVLAISVSLLVLIIARVVQLQTADAPRLLAAGDAQSRSEHKLRAQRGSILAMDGTELAITVNAATVSANPKLIADEVLVAETIGALLGLDAGERAELAKKLSDKSKSFVYVARQIDDQLGSTIAQLKLKGIDVSSEPMRHHPGGGLAPSVVGATDLDGTGIAGLERKYDAVLRGTDGTRVSRHDADGRTIAGADATTTAPIAGTDVVLTIDQSLQFQVERKLMSWVDQIDAKGGTVVIVDSPTGQIRAMASVKRDKDGTLRLTGANLAAVEAHDPGSVAKAFSIAAAIDRGEVTPETYFQVPGEYVFDKGKEDEKTIRDAEPHGIESYSVADIVTHSSNIGTMMVAARLGKEVLHDYHVGFGFGEKTAVALPDESAGILKTPDNLHGSEVATVSYGYGFSATPLQLTAAMNAIANGGLYVAPSLVSETIDAAGAIVPAPTAERHQVIKPSTAATMDELLTGVTCNAAGTGREARIPGFSVAGKTGTAYKLQADGTYGTDDNRDYYASFAGYFPAGRPQVTMFIGIDEPPSTTKQRFGGTAAAPLFSQIGRLVVGEMNLVSVPNDDGCVRG